MSSRAIAQSWRELFRAANRAQTGRGLRASGSARAPYRMQSSDGTLSRPGLRATLNDSDTVYAFERPGLPPGDGLRPTDRSTHQSMQEVSQVSGFVGESARRGSGCRQAEDI